MVLPNGPSDQRGLHIRQTPRKPKGLSPTLRWSALDTHPGVSDRSPLQGRIFGSEREPELIFTGGVQSQLKVAWFRKAPTTVASHLHRRRGA